jgi:hypothetical protein
MVHQGSSLCTVARQAVAGLLQWPAFHMVKVGLCTASRQGTLQGLRMTVVVMPAHDTLCSGIPSVAV